MMCIRSFQLLMAMIMSCPGTKELYVSIDTANERMNDGQGATTASGFLESVANDEIKFQSINKQWVSDLSER
jgi:hypothetical protein